MTIILTVVGVIMIVIGNLISFSLAGPLTPEFDEDDWLLCLALALLANAVGIIALIYR